MNILRKISFALTEAIFTVIPSVYNIFERIGSHEFFSSEAIQNISNNIYILVSVCMLFAFGIKLLNTIVNPDIIDDKKKGTKKTFINGIIAVVLISVVPFLFDVLYKVQFQVLGTDETTGEHHNLIQKIIFGTDGEYDSGSLLAGYTFAAFCYPNETVSNANLTSAGGNFYNKVIQGDIQYIDKVGDAINDEVNGEYELNYHIILSPLSGGYVLYQVILMCIDIAFRSVKLGVLQLMAPLVICAFIFAGTDMLTRWIKEVISTYIIVFVKVAAITFMVYALSLLPDLFERLGLVDSTRDSWAAKGFIRVAFLIGLLQLVKKLPEIINTIFGTKLNTNGDGGIRGRLGEMAGVGAAAQKAWDQLRTHPIQTAMKPVGAVAGVGANVVNRGIGLASELRKRAEDNGHGRFYRGAATVGGALLGVAGGGLTSIGAARRGWQNGARAIGQDAQYYRDTHQPGSTLEHRVLAGAARTFGFRTPYERLGRNDDIIDLSNNHALPQAFNGMTVEQLNNLRSQHEAFTQRRTALRDAAVHSIEENDSRIQMTVGGLGTGNYQQLRNALENLRNSGPKRGDYHGANAQAQYIHDLNLHNARVTRLEQRLTDVRNGTRDAIVDYTLSHNNVGGNIFTGHAITDNRGNVLGRISGELLGRDVGILETTTRSLRGMGEQAQSNAALDTNNRTHQNQMNDIDVALQAHQNDVRQRHDSDSARHAQASQQSIDNRRNNGGGGGNAGGGH